MTPFVEPSLNAMFNSNNDISSIGPCMVSGSRAVNHLIPELFYNDVDVFFFNNDFKIDIKDLKKNGWTRKTHRDEGYILDSIVLTKLNIDLIIPFYQRTYQEYFKLFDISICRCGFLPMTKEFIIDNQCATDIACKFIRIDNPGPRSGKRAKKYLKRLPGWRIVEGKGMFSP